MQQPGAAYLEARKALEEAIAQSEREVRVVKWQFIGCLIVYILLIVGFLYWSVHHGR
jgi:type IV secretory pathway TrbF-like protein